jgi:hypothetical protein
MSEWRHREFQQEDMKTISWLDEKAPDYAQGFVKFLFAIVRLFLFFTFFAVLVQLGTRHASTTPLTILERLWILTAAMWILFWTLCIKMLWSRVARWCLGLSSGVLFFYFSWIFVSIAAVLAMSLTGGHAVKVLPNSSAPYRFLQNPLLVGYEAISVVIAGFILLMIPLIGFGSMLWISLRSSPTDEAAWPDRSQGLPQFS